MILRQLGNPARLSSVQLLRFSKILEVLVICLDFDVNGSAHKVVVPFVEC